MRTLPHPAAPAPSGTSTFDRSWNAALVPADDVGVSVTSADRTSGFIYGTTATDNGTIGVITQADGRMRVQFNVQGPAGYDTDLANRRTERTKPAWVGEPVDIPRFRLRATRPRCE